MPVLQDHFYHRTITLLTGVFGSVFNDLKVVRSDGKTIKIPIAYQIRQKYDVRNNENPNPAEMQYRMSLPRMGFKLTGMQKDPTRSLGRFNKLTTQGVDRKLVNGIDAQYNRVPYMFQYQLNVKTKTLDDMLQIVEQIVVYFNPSLKVTVEDNQDINQNSSIVIRLLDSGIEDMFEGSFEQEQSMECTMNFELEGWLYMPTSTSAIIKKVTVNLFDMDSGLLIDKVVEVP